MASRPPAPPWLDRVGHVAQVGGIETSVLDNGPGRGTRIAWLDTGAGLRCKVLIDRALDIADAHFNARSLVWLSHGGVTAPRPDIQAGLDWLESFPGGLLTTCGLTHVGPPETDAGGTRGLHGRISNVAAELESVVQPDPWSGRLDMAITGVLRQSRVFGPQLELRRSITATLGRPVLRIRDVVTNRANTPSPHMLLYHCNFGWPLVDRGTEILWRGTCRSRGLAMDDAIFNVRRDSKTCPAPRKRHTGFGEACGFIDVTPDADGRCVVGLHHPKRQLAVALRYRKRDLPCLANWQHWGPGEYVTGLEPGTNFPIGRARAAAEGSLRTLAPGQSHTYELEFEVLTQARAIAALRRQTHERGTHRAARP